MSKLERYLEFNWPDLAKSTNGSIEDQAVSVMRELDQRLGAKDVEIDRLRKIEDAARAWNDSMNHIEASQNGRELALVLTDNPRPEESANG